MNYTLAAVIVLAVTAAACFMHLVRRLRRLELHVDALCSDIADAQHTISKLGDDWGQAFSNVERDWASHITQVRDEVISKTLLNQQRKTYR